MGTHDDKGRAIEFFRDRLDKQFGALKKDPVGKLIFEAALQSGEREILNPDPHISGHPSVWEGALKRMKTRGLDTPEYWEWARILMTAKELMALRATRGNSIRGPRLEEYRARATRSTNPRGKRGSPRPRGR